MEDQDKAMNMMPAGWGAPEVFFLKYLRALKTNPEPSLEDVLAAGDGDKLPTARKAEERYANSTFMPSDHAFFSTSMRFNPKAYHEGVLQTRPAWNYRPAWIAMEVSGNDTTYSERPEQKMGFNNTVIRQASNSDSDKSEYRTLLRRFNTAKGIAKLPEAKEETKSAPVSFTSFLKHMIPGLGEAYNQKVVAKHLFGTTKGGIVERFDNTRVPHNFVRNLK